ncbi:transmembrane protease serine 9-like [Hemicordylus capensis]|uniref:transmembrane protease serine 9-like n=1 Tax=Hemicordylus capensis TaxID=884348 RepID=UPI002303ECBF|nr:transmembrane protease serine 9-like [Hemicordylus capensis]
MNRADEFISVCGQPVISPRIVGGQDAEIGAWPWQMAALAARKGPVNHCCHLGLPRPLSEGGRQARDRPGPVSGLRGMSGHGGSSSEERPSQPLLLLLEGGAGEGFRKNSQKDLTVILGEYQIDDPSPHARTFRVSHVICNVAFEGVGNRGDIALLHLQGPLQYTPYILPVCMPDYSADFPEGMRCWITGWGAINYGVPLPYPRSLQQAKVALIGVKTCNEMFNVSLPDSIGSTPILDDMICAGYEAGQTDACQGDSGGPLVCAQNSSWFLVGIVSWGEDCGLPHRPGVYTRVTSYSGWLQHHVQSLQFGVVPITLRAGGSHVCCFTSSSPLPFSVAFLLSVLQLGFMGCVLENEAQSQDAENGTQTMCGQVVAKNRIVGGEDSSYGAWPWQVSLQYKQKHICGGTLINAEWVLTATHCFPGNAALSDYRANLGNYQLSNPDSNALWLRLSQVILHEDYVTDGSSGDIALAQLEQPVHFTQGILPACLPDAKVQFPNGTLCWVTGWGAPQYGATLGAPKTLQQIQLPLIDTLACDAMYHIGTGIKASIREVQDDMICAGYATGGKDACLGDSGGPLVCQEDGAWFVAGIVSWGDMCAIPNRPGVYTRVSFYEDWIKIHLPQAQFGLVNITYYRVMQPSFASRPVSKDFYFLLLLTASFLTWTLLT